MTKFVGIAVNSHNVLWALSSDGQIWREGLEPAAHGQTRSAWFPVKGPDTTHKVTNIACGAQGANYCLAGGRLFAQEQDRTAMAGARLLWREIDPPKSEVKE